MQSCNNNSLLPAVRPYRIATDIYYALDIHNLPKYYHTFLDSQCPFSTLFSNC